MAKGKEKKVEQPVENPEVETPAPEAQAEAPTPPDIEALLAKAKEEGKAEAEKVYKGYQRTVAQREREIEQLKKQQATLPQPSFSPSIANEIVALLEAQQSELGEPNPRIAYLKGLLAVEQQKEWQRQQQTQWDTHVAEEETELSEEIESRGLNPQDEKLKAVQEAFQDAAKRTGNFTKAYRLLDRVTKETKPKVEEKKVEVPEEIDEEKIRKYLEKKGMLKSDTGGPSGAGGKLTAEQITKMSPKERFERRKEISEMSCLGEK